ncbi:recombinase family protein [Paraburkholderia strydomiana]|uniref:recombinase family protein n=1 Tax=Paraburkholderia strydomiana TaxID=1245417 RepID=UPI0038BC34BF
MPRAYSYVRFSTPEQSKGDSLRRQQELSEAYAAKHGLTLDTTLTFHDLGVSAYKGSNVERGRLGDFLHACDTGLVLPGSYLLVESLDRLSRAEVIDAFDLFRSILKKQITIVTLTDNRVYSSRTTEMTDLIISLTVMSRAHDESLTKSKRQRAAWNNKRANIGTKKLTARSPLWLKLNADRTEFDFIPERVEIVKEIISLAKNGFGQLAIAKMLNERGTPAFSGEKNAWHSSYIQKILTSKQLYGEFQPGETINGRKSISGSPIDDYYPAVITKDEFYSLQAFRAQNAVGGGRARKGTTVPNLLSGLLRCGYCGRSNMVIAGAAAKRVKTPEGETIRPPKKVLVCDAARRGMGCYAVQWGYNEFEAAFLTFCRGLSLDALLADLRNDTGPQPVKLEDQLHAEEQKIDDIQKNIDKLFDLFLSATELTKAEVQKQLSRLTTDKTNAEAAKERLLIEIQQRKDSGTDSREVARVTKSLIEQMSSVTDEERFRVRAALAAQLRRFIDTVELHGAGRLVTKEFIKKQKAGLIEAGMSKAEAAKYCDEHYQTEPKRQGKGDRGRFASRADNGRFFVIRTKHGGFRVVYPRFDDPTVATVQGGFNDGGPGLIGQEDLLPILLNEINEGKE